MSLQGGGRDGTERFQVYLSFCDFVCFVLRSLFLFYFIYCFSSSLYSWIINLTHFVYLPDMCLIGDRESTCNNSKEHRTYVALGNIQLYSTLIESLLESCVCNLLSIFICRRISLWSPTSENYWCVTILGITSYILASYTESHITHYSDSDGEKKRKKIRCSTRMYVWFRPVVFTDTESLYFRF